MRVALIHALAHSSAPINDEFARAAPVVDAVVTVPVLTTPASAVRALRARLAPSPGGA
jgi:hypothetical protein